LHLKNITVIRDFQTNLSVAYMLPNIPSPSAIITTDSIAN